MKPKTLMRLLFLTMMLSCIGGLALRYAAGETSSLSRANASSFGDTWLTYTDTNDVRDIAVQGDAAWCAATGGALRRNLKDGSETVYRARDGLADNRVNAIAVDSRGTVWCGTAGGVSRFDGVSWQTWTVDDSLVVNTVTDIAIDSSDQVWITVNEPSSDRSGSYTCALQRYDGEQWITVQKITYASYGGYDTLVYNPVQRWLLITQWRYVYRYTPDTGKMTYCGSTASPASFTIDQNGIAWAIENGNPVTCDGVRLNPVVPERENLRGRMKSVIAGPEGTLWFATDSGLARYEGNSWSVFRPDDFYYLNPLMLFAADTDGGVWGVSRRGAVRFAAGVFTDFSSAVKLPGNEVRAVAIDLHDVKWFGTAQGVSSFDGYSWKLYTMEGGLCDNRINAIAIDRENVKWIATEGGVSRFDGSIWKTFSKDTGDFPDSSVTAIGVSPGNTPWAGLRTGETLYYRDGSWVDCSYIASGQEIRDLAFAGGDTVWAASSRRVFQYNGKGWLRYASTPNDSRSVFVQRGQCWTGGQWAAPDGIMHRDGDAFVPVFPRSELLSGPVTDIAEDRNGHLWFTVDSADSGGIAVFDGSAWTVFRKNTLNLADTRINGIAVDHDNVKWIAARGGVTCLRNDISIRYVRLLSPLGGEQWEIGTECEIVWDSRGIEALRIELSYDNGATWRTLEERAPAAPGVYRWMASGPDGRNVAIRITDFSGGLTDSGDRPFTILPPRYSTGLGKWTFTPYPAKIDSLLKDSVRNDMTAFTIDHDGMLWAGFEQGEVCAFRDSVCTLYRPETIGLFPYRVNDILVDKDNRKWRGSSRMVNSQSILACFDGASWKQYFFLVDVGVMGIPPIPCGITRVNQLALDNNGDLWLAGQGGIIRILEDDSWLVYSKSEGFFKYGDALSVAVDRNNRKWVVLCDSEKGSNGLACFSGDTFDVLDGPQYCDFAGKPITFVLAGYANEILFGFPGTVLSLRDSTVRTVREDSDIRDAVTDRNGDFWLIEYRSESPREFRNILWIHDGEVREFPGNGFLFNRFLRVCSDANNTVWLASENGLWRFEPRAVPVFVKERKPAAVAMVTNYPNPFNPFTTIAYTLPASGAVSLTVFDITGQKVAELARGNQSAGAHTVVWNAKGFASGVYFCTLRAGKAVETRKLLLVR